MKISINTKTKIGILKGKIIISHASWEQSLCGKENYVFILIRKIIQQLLERFLKVQSLDKD